MTQRSSTARGDAFEERVLRVLRRSIDTGDFFAKPECCELFHKKAYYSRDRADNIVFDLAVEIRMPGAAEPSLLVLIECKNLSRMVSVDDAEEFFGKLQQIAGGGCKGVMVSPRGFQKGAVSFAGAKGIGLARCFSEDDLKWELRRSPVASTWDGCDVGHIETAILSDDYRNATSAFYCLAPSGPATSLNDLLRRLAAGHVGDEALTPARQASASVPFLGKEHIQEMARGLLRDADYHAGAAPLDAIGRQSGVLIERGVSPGKDEIDLGILGRISFDQPTTITLYDHPTQQATRTRFTLAHELGHFFLGHGAYVAAEYCDVADHDAGGAPGIQREDIRRMEWQANFFASQLLLPAVPFARDLARIAQALDLRDRGHGLIYLDHQPVNVGIYHRVTTELKQLYNVSRAVVAVRLKELGVLRDVRTRTSQRIRDIL